ncbi:uncharacterized protein EV422DRAFT_291146 [Fimicolochytrium jonesii]|uniref:uncharacterized protein n=1 Tax=Fimicolochytrium jonesii TaxID=1396493 RepID=UPI0022FE2249|nr:uncharacterized protein EV422DRAFT_291146 [Fimicolochytrium jonesii]KAI8816397.1 hypothetical protein EV422DRAFT_291146 [Fimicolochytrium jonesii]
MEMFSHEGVVSSATYTDADIPSELQVPSDNFGFATPLKRKPSSASYLPAMAFSSLLSPISGYGSEVSSATKQHQKDSDKRRTGMQSPGQPYLLAAMAAGRMTPQPAATTSALPVCETPMRFVNVFGGSTHSDEALRIGLHKDLSFDSEATSIIATPSLYTRTISDDDDFYKNLTCPSSELASQEHCLSSSPIVFDPPFGGLPASADDFGMDTSGDFDSFALDIPFTPAGRHGQRRVSVLSLGGLSDSSGIALLAAEVKPRKRKAGEMGTALGRSLAGGDEGAGEVEKENSRPAPIFGTPAPKRASSAESGRGKTVAATPPPAACECCKKQGKRCESRGTSNPGIKVDLADSLKSPRRGQYARPAKVAKTFNDADSSYDEWTHLEFDDPPSLTSDISSASPATFNHPNLNDSQHSDQSSPLPPTFRTDATLSLSPRFLYTRSPAPTARTGPTSTSAAGKSPARLNSIYLTPLHHAGRTATTAATGKLSPAGLSNAMKKPSPVRPSVSPLNIFAAPASRPPSSR